MDVHALTNPSIPKKVVQNISHLVEYHRQRNRKLNVFFRVSDKATELAGSTGFLFLHFLWFAAWLLWNTGELGSAKPFDPYPFSFLTLVVSLEAIVLAIMVLMVQNKIQEDAEREAELDVHVNLLAERESTMILRKLVRIEEKLGIDVGVEEREDVDELLEEVDPIEIEKMIDQC